MGAVIEFLLDYFKRLADSNDKSAAIHDAAFGLGTLCLGVWLSYGCFQGKGFTPNWTQLAIAFASLVGIPKASSIFADRPRKEEPHDPA